MYGIDISSHQYYDNGHGGMTAECQPYFDKAECVIIKATQGVNYVNPACDKGVQECIRRKKCWGFYHYASNNDPISEARYFYEHTKNYFKHGVPVIDWEAGQNERNWGDVNWVRQFVNEVHRLSGVWCMIYVQASAIAQVANCANDCALWVAQYNNVQDMPIAPWKAKTAWQYTSTPVDQNEIYVDRAAWNRIAMASGGNSGSTTKPVEPVKDYEKIATDVIAGKYGNGEERKRKLGADYDKVQAIVNTRLQPKHRTYVVKEGDTLSGVFGNDWPRVAKLNNLANPNVIYPGQKLLY